MAVLFWTKNTATWHQAHELKNETHTPLGYLTTGLKPASSSQEVTWSPAFRRLRLWRICPLCGRPRLDSWARKIPCRRKWQRTPVFLPGEFHGQRSLVGYSPWSCKELDMTKWLTGEGNGSPLQYSCLENPMDGGAWWAAVHGVAKSLTRLSDLAAAEWVTLHFTIQWLVELLFLHDLKMFTRKIVTNFEQL